MSDERKRKPSVWRIIIILVLSLAVGYFIFTGVVLAGLIV